jgi:hypothetical protein
MIFDAKFDNVSVPPPLNVTFAALISNAVVFADPFIVIDPALLMVLPLTVSVAPLLKLRVSVTPRVRLEVAAPLIFKVTIEFAVLMHALVLLVGIPALQLPAAFHTPEAPPVQLVPHCAKAESGNKKSARSATSKIWRETFSLSESFFAAKNRVCMATLLIVNRLVKRLLTNVDRIFESGMTGLPGMAGLR